MITHDEALTPLKEIAEKLTRKQWLELTEKIETIRAYIKQQETLQAKHEALKLRNDKVTELLGLYRSVHGVVQSWDTMPDVEAKIQKLEKELGEMK